MRNSRVLAGLLGITWGALACAAPSPDADDAGSGANDGAAMSDEESPNDGQGVSPDSAIIAAQEELTPIVMGLDGVNGTAVGLCDGEPCIKVYVTRDDDALRSEIPETFQGFRVDAEVTGGFEARDAAD